MARKPSLADIARAAGVGPATVERVLNARGNVREETAERVVRAAERLGFDRRLPERYHGIVRIEVVLIQPDSAFFKRINVAFMRIAATLSRSVHVQRTFLDEYNLADFARHIALPEARRSALIIVAPDDPRIISAISATRAAGIPTVSIVSDIGGAADAFVGIDNYAAGRAAAHYLTGFNRHRQGAFLVLSHSAAYDVHRERLRGFSSYISESGDPGHDLPMVAFGRDDPQETERALREAFAATPGVIGLYNAGGANRAVAAFLHRQAARGTRVMWIGHELTAQSREWLKSGSMHLVLDQAPEAQARRAIDTVLHLLGFIDGQPDADPMPFITYSVENC